MPPSKEFFKSYKTVHAVVKATDFWVTSGETTPGPVIGSRPWREQFGNGIWAWALVLKPEAPWAVLSRPEDSAGLLWVPAWDCQRPVPRDSSCRCWWFLCFCLGQNPGWSVYFMAAEREMAAGSHFGGVRVGVETTYLCYSVSPWNVMLCRFSEIS